MENKNICLQCDQKDIILDSGVCPHCDYLNRKNDYLQNDGNITITKDNIHLYYEFMSDDDKFKYRNLFTRLFQDRINKISEFLNISMEYFNIHFKTDRKIHLILDSFIFGIKDALKPIDEYIEEIKESNEYKEYIKNKQ